MTRAVLIVALLALAGCGADGDPTPRRGGVSVSGTATIGVSGEF